MKNTIIQSLLLMSLLFTALLFSSPAFAQSPAHNVCFYSQPNFQGQSYCSSPGMNTPDVSQIVLGGQMYDWEGAIMSIQIIGNAKVTVWEGKGYSGTSLTLTSSQADLGNVYTSQGNYDWANVISSYKTHW
jgi:hypothetical protein